MKRIVVIGASGHFGSRICRRIAGVQHTELLISSRSERKAQALVEELRANDGSAAIRAARLDHESPQFVRELRALQPDIVIHTAGPFQGQDYRVAEACLAAGSHYIDLADGRDFVANFASLDAAARRKDLLLVAGASTLPGVSSIVIDALREKFTHVREIRISIAPAHQTPRGAGTIAAVLSYCGRPFDVMEQGRWVTRHGWQNLRLQRYPQLGSRLSAACDVPDLDLMPDYVPGVETITFHAALEAPWEQLALWSMGWLTRAGLIKSWDRFVPYSQRLGRRLINLGSVNGGMQIKLAGTLASGKQGALDWNLLARQNHGPEIPCSPALILARKLLANAIPARGAVPCLGMFSMTELASELSGFDIQWQLTESNC